VTHRLAGGAIGRPGDALAIVTDGRARPDRLFVPGVLPCGECPTCRRGLCAACTAARPAFGDTGASAEDLTADLPDRFLVSVGDESLPAAHLVAAGLAAEIIGAAARAGLGPGETAVWMGQDPWARLGASWSARRGCRTFWIPSPASTGDAPPADVERLDPAAPATEWRRLVESSEAAGGPAGGRPERKIFVCDPTGPLAAAALALAVPGASLSLLRAVGAGAPVTIADLNTALPLRLLTGSAYHPDLISEAIAAIRRGDIAVGDAVREVPAGGGDAINAAVDDFRAGRDRRLPVAVLSPIP
jgi:threonine dehydrogenase-like Zn-dependent dehydrogenase